MVDLRLQPGGQHATRAVDDLTQLLAAVLAAWAGAIRARANRGRARISWLLIAVGAGCWAAGELVWSYYELVANTPTPFPSLADLGYLLFPTLAGVGLLTRPSRAFEAHGRLRIALDAGLIVASLFALSWATALGQVYRNGAGATFSRIVALAYPASDVALLTVTAVVLTYAHRGDRIGMLWIGGGLVPFAVADSGFAYLTAQGRYSTGNLVDVGWVGGFLILACAALLDRGLVAEAKTDERLTPRSALALPYLPAALGVIAAFWRLRADRDDGLVLAAAAVVVSLLVARQLVVLLDNQRLIAQISHQALHDVLTGLANRALFSDRLSHALDLHRRDLRSITVVLIDLDDFKTINDSLGHPAGDELLVRVAERLLASMRSSDTVARLGGDEFALLVEDGGDGFDVAARVLKAFDHPVAIGLREIPVGASVGIATLAPSATALTATEMLRRADLAMYAAKHEGKGVARSYNENIDDNDTRQLDLRSALAADLAQGRIDVAFQPIHLAGGVLYGYEALARWTHGGEPISPADFIPIARRLGSIATLDLVVLRTALRAAAGWAPDLALSVNLDSHTLAEAGLLATVAQLLRETGYAAPRLTIEVLETSLIEDDDRALATLHQLRALGIRVAVDDFGAGYSSLARLHTLQPDIVKIDRTLIASHGNDASSLPLLAGIAHLAHQFGALVIAEGIETDRQLSSATTAGCDAMQGYLLGRPRIPDPLPTAEVGSAA